MSQPFPPAFAGPVASPRPKAPGATLAMVLGIIAVGGGLVLLVPMFLAPLAWYHGMAASRRVEREPDRWAGRGEAQAGLVLGMIGTGLLAVLLGLLLLSTLGVAFLAGHDVGYGT